jgi:VWFA-related protein
MQAKTRRRSFPAALAAVLTVLHPVPPSSASGTPRPQAPQAEPPVFGVQASAVLLDVVVRDKKGNLVRDLAASDFEVYEDGARQTLDSFRVFDVRPLPARDAASAGAAPEAAVSGAAASGAAAPPGTVPAGTAAPATAAPAGAAAANAAAAAVRPSVIAFVFDRLSTNARKLAYDASRSYAERGHVEGDLVAVFSVDQALRTLQPFTNDLEAIKRGLQFASTQPNTAFASEREETRRRLEAVGRADEGLAGIQGSGDAGSQTMASLVAAQQALDRMQVNLTRMFDVLERDQQGLATTNALLAIVNGLKALPGRKTVVFFSEGIAIPSAVQAQFESVIASANRANVSVYAIDAGGLRTQSGTREARDELMQGARQRVRQEESGGRAFNPREAMSRQLERNEDMLRLSAEAGLGELASATGGFLVSNTNDAGRGFQRIQEDMRFHYLLSYAPTNTSFDGRFRTISIKLRRPGLEVQARKGYFAVRPEHVLPVRGYEAPALAELERSPRPQAFPLHVEALSFPESGRPGLAPVLVELPGGAVAWTPDRTGSRAEFAVVVRIKDERGREADRLSQQYLLSAQAENLEAARRGNVLFYREAELRPGRYTVEAVAHDAIAHSASVKTAALEVPAVEEGRPRLSSIVLVGRGEKLGPQEQAETSNPLRFGEVMLYPALGRPFPKSAQAVGFYFSVYGWPQAAAARSALIELLQGERVVTRATSELAAPDASGRIQHAGALPIASLAPGSYTLRVSVGAGAAAQSRTAALTIVD